MIRETAVRNRMETTGVAERVGWISATERIWIEGFVRRVFDLLDPVCQCCAGWDAWKLWPVLWNRFTEVRV
jgi:hypothetical protein